MLSAKWPSASLGHVRLIVCFASSLVLFLNLYILGFGCKDHSSSCAAFRFWFVAKIPKANHLLDATWSNDQGVSSGQMVKALHSGTWASGLFGQMAEYPAWPIDRALCLRSHLHCFPLGLGLFWIFGFIPWKVCWSFSS